MRAAVITFPGSNCDRDLAVAFERILSCRVERVWHRDSDLGDVDLIGVPGGFSYGDFLRCGAIAARSPIMADLLRKAEAGVPVLGICNGFQILTECGLLPGALIRNRGLSFVCRPAGLEVASDRSPFTSGYRRGERITLPVAHHDGNYVIDPDGLSRLEDEDRIAFRYLDNPNGSTADIAGVLNRRRNVLGLMPHPERAIEPALGGVDGKRMFEGFMEVAG
ncbi:MAG: phosphoribosylformylglycinamidine synthase subunit PurQ [Geminicoccaceae bacterium]